MKKLEMLSGIKLGKSIAELDTELMTHYINNTQTNSIISGTHNIVLGAKGTGKSSILKYIENVKGTNKNLGNKSIIFAMNHTGEPIFKELFTKAEGFSEDDLIMSWKMYIINLIWKEHDSELTILKGLDKYLKAHNVVFDSGSYKTMIQKAVALTKLFQYKCTDASGFEHSLELQADKALEYINSVNSTQEKPFDVNFVLGTINTYLQSKGLDIWIMIDRVDEAIINNPELEVRTLRALLRTFNDLVQFEHISPKLMLRNDIFETITGQGFAALSHIDAHCTPQILWTMDQLMLFIVKRIFSNDSVRKYYNISTNMDDLKIEEAKELFYLMFDEQVDKGIHKPKTFNWIYNHLEDGTGSVTPRDLLNYFEKLFVLMGNAEIINPLVEKKLSYKPTVFKEAWKQTSEGKLTTQIFAEYNDLRPYIEKFKDSKAKHTKLTIDKIIGKDKEHVINNLVKISFLKSSKDYYEIPYLYRGHLNVKNGEATI